MSDINILSATKNWITEQVWRDVVFLHYKIDPDLIQDQVPFPLDLHEGKCVLSIVPFFMEGIRFPYLPAVPWFSELGELNIRTYVEVNGVKGIYFFTLDTDSKLAEFIANNFFHLPYRLCSIHADVSKNQYLFDHKRGDLSFLIEANILEDRKSSEFDLWATERYSLFTMSKTAVYRGDVIHESWKLKNIELKRLENHFTKMVTSHSLDFAGAAFSSGLKVRFIPFTKLYSRSS